MITREVYEGFEAFRLSNDTLELLVVPAIGGKIVSLRRREGREWLWKNAHLKQTRASYGDSFVQLHDTGGWDECFPTVNPCTLPNGVQLPDHGELVTQAWQVQKTTENSIHLAVEGVVTDYRFERTLTLEKDQLDVAYRVENRSGKDMPFTWCCHPLLSIDQGMTINLSGKPSGKTTFVTYVGPVGVDFTHPSVDYYDLRNLSPSGIGMKSFVGPLHDGWVALSNDSEELRFTFDLQDIQYVAFWMNYGAWSGCGSPNYFNLGIEPCIGPYDSLEEAIKAGGAPVIEAGEVREWSLTIEITGSEPAR